MCVEGSKNYQISVSFPVWFDSEVDNESVISLKRVWFESKMSLTWVWNKLKKLMASVLFEDVKITIQNCIFYEIRAPRNWANSDFGKFQRVKIWISAKFHWPKFDNQWKLIFLREVCKIEILLTLVWLNLEIAKLYEYFSFKKESFGHHSILWRLDNWKDENSERKCLPTF